MNKRFFNISAFFFFYFALIGVYVIFLPKILENIGYTSTQIDIIFSVAPLMRFITPFFFLKLFALTKNVLHIALGFMLITIPLFYLTIENFYLFALANIIYGVSSGLVLPYIETYALEVLQKEYYGKSRLYGSIGFIFVALVLARMLEDNYMGLHFAAVTILLSVFFAAISARDNQHFSNQQHNKDENFDLLKHLPLWVSIFLMQVSFGAFYSFFTIYESAHGLSLSLISYLWTFGVLCEVVLFYFQAYFLKFNLLKIIQITLILTALRWFLLFLFPNALYIVFVSQSLHAFSFALYHTATLSFLYLLYQDKKLAAQFYYGLGFGLGGFFGSLVAGYFYGKYLFLISAGIALIGFLVIFPMQTKLIFSTKKK